MIWEEDGVSETRFDTVVRQAAERLSRRRSLLALGSVGLATLSGSSVTHAKKKHKRKRKPTAITQRANRKCQAQVIPCQQSVAAAGGSAQLVVCCQFLAVCDAGAFVGCIAANSK